MDRFMASSILGESNGRWWILSEKAMSHQKLNAAFGWVFTIDLTPESCCKGKLAVIWVAVPYAIIQLSILIIFLSWVVLWGLRCWLSPRQLTMVQKFETTREGCRGVSPMPVGVRRCGPCWMVRELPSTTTPACATPRGAMSCSSTVSRLALLLNRSF